MPRLTISLPNNLYNRLFSLATQHEESMSSIINRLILTGMVSEAPPSQTIEQHCQQLIMQMNALIKSISVELLEYNQDSFEKLQQAVLNKYNELKYAQMQNT